jgi:hypothetical protein
MKKILIIIMSLGFAVLAACNKEKLATVSSNTVVPVISSPGAGTSIVVTIADSSTLLNVTWQQPNYGVAAVVSYFVEVDSAGKNFSKYVNLQNLTSTTTFSLSYNNLNAKLLSGLNLAPNAATTIELRVGSAIYGKDTVYSKPVTIALTTLALNQLWLPGSYENYSPATAPTIPATLADPSAYEGFAYFSSPGNFKFTSAPDYSHINYGDGGNGTLTTNGNAGGIVYPSAGVYLLDADVSKLTYSATLISTFGIIGTATAGQWNSSTPMTYNQSTGLWTITASLTAGALKFRANNGWDINYGPSDSNALTGTLIFNDPGSINITTAGTYTITMDMTQSKQTAYLYSVVQN